MSHELSRMLRLHWRMPFPDSVEKGATYGRVEPVSIDADLYGWAGRASEKTIDSQEREQFRRAAADLAASLNSFPQEARLYFTELLLLAELALEILDKWSPATHPADLQPLDREGATPFSAGQVAAVRASFLLAGYDGELRTLQVDSDDERLFVVDQKSIPTMDVRSLEQILTQVLSRKVWVIDSIDSASVPFE